MLKMLAILLPRSISKQKQFKHTNKVLKTLNSAHVKLLTEHNVCVTAGYFSRQVNTSSIDLHFHNQSHPPNSSCICTYVLGCIKQLEMEDKKSAICSKESILNMVIRLYVCTMYNFNMI